MPIHDYKCGCGKVFEAMFFSSSIDRSAQICPACGLAAKRVKSK